MTSKIHTFQDRSELSDTEGDLDLGEMDSVLSASTLVPTEDTGVKNLKPQGRENRSTKRGPDPQTLEENLPRGKRPKTCKDGDLRAIIATQTQQGETLQEILSIHSFATRTGIT